MNAGWWLGWAAGLALAIVIAIVVPSIGFIGGVVLGFGLSQMCAFIGMKAYDR